LKVGLVLDLQRMGGRLSELAIWTWNRVEQQLSIDLRVSASVSKSQVDKHPIDAL